MPPKLSVITICFNASSLIEKTLESVEKQTFTDYEYIIQDGGSRDNTLEIVGKHANERYRIFSEKDRGIYDALNKALAKASGDYVCFLHAGDTLFDAHTLEHVFPPGENADFIYGDALMINAAGQTRPWYKTKPAESALSWKSFINGMVICHQAMFIKRSCCEPFDTEHWKIANDVDWSIRTLRRCQSVRDTGVPLVYFLDGGVSDTRRWQALRERWQILTRHFGLWATLVQHIKIVFQALRRGSLD